MGTIKHFLRSKNCSDLWPRTTVTAANTRITIDESSGITALRYRVRPRRRPKNKMTKPIGKESNAVFTEVQGSSTDMPSTKNMAIAREPSWSQVTRAGVGASGNSTELSLRFAGSVMGHLRWELVVQRTDRSPYAMIVRTDSVGLTWSLGARVCFAGGSRQSDSGRVFTLAYAAC